jgi:ribonuclease HII
MGARRRGKSSAPLFRFDQPFHRRYARVAGVDEAGRGPLAGPVVSAAVILEPDCRIPRLNDSKLVSAEARWILYRHIQRCALAIGVGIVEQTEIDRLNIYWASFVSMRVALSQLMIQPDHVLVDGFKIPNGPPSQTGIIDGDKKSASIAAAAIVAKVTRDCIMESWDRHYPQYGFKQHKGYTTRLHLERLSIHGPCPIHRRSFAPVRLSLTVEEVR